MPAEAPIPLLELEDGLEMLLLEREDPDTPELAVELGIREVLSVLDALDAPAG
jgi:hypothetical protein